MISKIYSLLFSYIFYFIILSFSLIEADNNIELINNIFEVEKDFRYLTFASYSNGDMIFSTTAFPKTTKRIFYGFKNNGRPFFHIGTEYYYSKNVEMYDSKEEKFESEAIVIKLSGSINNRKEYLISTGNKESYVEIYDFENNIEYKKSMTNFANGKYVGSFRNTAISLISDDNNYYYIFGYTIENNNNFNYSIQIHKFNSLADFGNKGTIIKNTSSIKSHHERDGVSCFQTKKKYIICFLLTSTKEYKIFIFSSDNNLSHEYQLSIYTNNNINSDEFPFYKCIHFKEEIGIFFYYKYDDYLNSCKPTILFKQNENSILKNYTISEII